MTLHPFIARRFEIAEQDPGRALIGRGGMGEVYRGRDIQTGQAVAIKVLKSEIVAHHPDFVERFVREGQALRQLNHPNIVKWIDAFQEAGRYYLVMEYVTGGSLQDKVEHDGALAIPRALEISLDLADALTRAHRLGIIHRDLKPANVLLAADGSPRLTDFGMAYIAGSSRLTEKDVVVGTLDYLSPEACRGEALDERADIWGLGVLLYEMLTGKRPFTHETVAATLIAILTRPIPDPAALQSQLPEALIDLVYRMLEKDRHQRIPSVRLVGAEIEALLQARDTTSGRIYLADPASRFGTPTSQRTGARKHNLPPQATPFVGREAALIELSRLLENPDARLLTILGAGGMGKTRLALQATTAQLDHFEHGVFFVSLAPLQAVEAIVPAIAEALDFGFYTGEPPREQLFDYLHQKNLLLVLDNYEHLLAGAGLAADILRAAPRIKILTTSRIQLNIQGEHLFTLGGMDFPDWETPEDALGYSAVRLFLQSARRARPGFELAAEDLRYIARICRLVEGMPLAIILAAAWVFMLSPKEIAAEIQRSPDLLETGARDAPERQRSIRAVFEHSWNLLDEGERQVFQSLSVFGGGFTRQAAQAVAGATLRELMGLVSKSLLHRAPSGRYQVHELLRQYAAERLARSPDLSRSVRGRHSDYYTTTLARWAQDLKGPRRQAAWTEMEIEIDNVRLAWDRAIEQANMTQIDRAVEAVRLFYIWSRRLEEGKALFGRATESLSSLDPPLISGEDVRVMARVQACYGAFSRAVGDEKLADRLLQQSLDLLDRPDLAALDTRRERMYILQQTGLRYLWPDPERARQAFEEDLALCQQLGDRWEMALVLNSLGFLAMNAGELDRARQLAQKSLSIRQEIGDRRGQADTLYILSYITRMQEHLDEAETFARQCFAIHQELGDRASLAEGLCELGTSLIFHGQFDEAHELLEESVAIWQELGSRHLHLEASTKLSMVKMHLGQYEQALDLARESLARAGELQVRAEIALAHLIHGNLSLVQGVLADAWQHLEASLAFFLEIVPSFYLLYLFGSLGLWARRMAQPAQAWHYLYRGLQTLSEVKAIIGITYVIPGISLLLIDEGRLEQAIELYELVKLNPYTARSRWFRDVAGQQVAAAEAALPPQILTAAQARGQARELQATSQELITFVREKTSGKTIARCRTVYSDEFN